MKFTNFTAIASPRKSKRISSITVRPLLKDCTEKSVVYFTDIKAQEGYPRTGFTENTIEKLIRSPNPPRFHNGVIRGGMTVIIPNTGGTSSGLDCYIYPKHSMEAGTVTLAQGEGAQKTTLFADVNAGDVLALLASSRRCLKNGAAIQKEGFFQYTAAHDSKHIITIPDGTSARVYFEYYEMTEAITD